MFIKNDVSSDSNWNVPPTDPVSASRRPQLDHQLSSSRNHSHSRHDPHSHKDYGKISRSLCPFSLQSVEAEQRVLDDTWAERTKRTSRCTPRSWHSSKLWTSTRPPPPRRGTPSRGDVSPRMPLSPSTSVCTRSSTPTDYSAPTHRDWRFSSATLSSSTRQTPTSPPSSLRPPWLESTSFFSSSPKVPSPTLSDISSTTWPWSPTESTRTSHGESLVTNPNNSSPIVTGEPGQNSTGASAAASPGRRGLEGTDNTGAVQSPGPLHSREHQQQPTTGETSNSKMIWVNIPKSSLLPNYTSSHQPSANSISLLYNLDKFSKEQLFDTCIRNSLHMFTVRRILENNGHLNVLSEIPLLYDLVAPAETPSSLSTIQNIEAFYLSLSFNLHHPAQLLSNSSVANDFYVLLQELKQKHTPVPENVNLTPSFNIPEDSNKIPVHISEVCSYQTQRERQVMEEFSDALNSSQLDPTAQPWAPIPTSDPSFHPPPPPPLQDASTSRNSPSLPCEDFLSSITPADLDAVGAEHNLDELLKLAGITDSELKSEPTSPMETEN